MWVRAAILSAALLAGPVDGLAGNPSQCCAPPLLGHGCKIVACAYPMPGWCQSKTDSTKFVNQTLSSTDWEENVSGLSVELFKGIAASLGWSYEVRLAPDIEGNFEWIKDGTCQVAIGGSYITPSRAACPTNATPRPEQCLDFTFSFLQSDYVIVYLGNANTKTETAVFDFSEICKKPQIINMFMLLCLAILVAGHLMWFFERNANSEQFPQSYLDGVDDGVWWSAVTVTTVGYGDKAPVTRVGRSIAIMWMVVGIILNSYFTGVVTSGITVDSLAAAATPKPDELVKKVTLAVAGATYKYAQERNPSPKVVVKVSNNREGITKLLSGEHEYYMDDLAVIENLQSLNDPAVYDASKFIVVKMNQPEKIGFATNESSCLTTYLNSAMLTFTASDGDNHPKLIQWLEDYFPKIEDATSAKHKVDFTLLAVLITFFVVFCLIQGTLIINRKRRQRLGLALFGKKGRQQDTILAGKGALSFKLEQRTSLRAGMVVELAKRGSGVISKITRISPACQEYTFRLVATRDQCTLYSEELEMDEQLVRQDSTAAKTFDETLKEMEEMREGVRKPSSVATALVTQDNGSALMERLEELGMRLDKQESMITMLATLLQNQDSKLSQLLAVQPHAVLTPPECQEQQY